MRLVVGFAIGLLVLCAPGLGFAQTSTKKFQMVGVSSTAVAGDVGLFGMAQACQQDFPASRMCTTREVVGTVSVPEMVGEAWVQIVVASDGDSICGRIDFVNI